MRSSRAGPDGKLGTADDVAIALPHQWQQHGQDWWMADGHRIKNQQIAWNRRGRFLRDGAEMNMLEGGRGGAGSGRFLGAMPQGAVPRAALARGGDEVKKEAKADVGDDRAGAAPAAARCPCASVNTSRRRCSGGRRSSPTTAAGPSCR